MKTNETRRNPSPEKVSARQTDAMRWMRRQHTSVVFHGATIVILTGHWLLKSF
jgi:hypothetical protein